MIEPTQTYQTSLIRPFYDNLWSYEDIHNYSKKPHRVLFGLGNTSPWHIDMLADPVHPFTTRQVQLFGYIKAVPTPVIPVAAEELDNYPEAITVQGQHYLPIEPELEVITENQCYQILYRGKLEHDKIKATDSPNCYRSVGIYINVEYTGDDEELLTELFNSNRSPFIDKKQASGDLLYLRHLTTPSFITPRLVEDIVEVVSFTRFS